MAEETEAEKQARIQRMKEHLAELERKNNKDMQEKGLTNPYGDSGAK